MHSFVQVYCFRILMKTALIKFIYFNYHFLNILNNLWIKNFKKERKKRKANNNKNNMSETKFDQNSNTTALDSDQMFLKVFNQLDKNRRINLIASVFIIVLGLIGNSTIAFVFYFKKFRIGPNQIYLFYLSIIDALFLVVHLFEVKNIQISYLFQS